MDDHSAEEQQEISVLLVDDQPLLRTGFSLVLEGEDQGGGAVPIRVVAEAGNGREAVELVAEHRPDVVLMDVRMPEMDGIEATRLIVESGAPSKVIILTTFDLDEYAFTGLQAGASAFLLKDVEPEELAKAVRVVHDGDSVVAPRITKRLLETYVTGGGSAPSADHLLSTPEQEQAAKALGQLSPRESQVLQVLAQGMSNAEIAERLYLSEATVKSHVRSILIKLGLRDRVQAVVYAYEYGVVTPGSVVD